MRSNQIADESRDTVVVIPTFNEAENILTLIDDLLALDEPLDILIVDDNSPDGTGRLVDEAAARLPGRLAVIHRAGKLGLGTAYVEGWRWVLARSYARILTMDADYSHHPRHIPALLAASAEYQVVIGSRYTADGSVRGSTLFRRSLSRAANQLARTILGVRSRDLTGAFRVYDRRVIESFPLEGIRSEGYSFLIETAWLAERLGWRLGEVPITFENRTLGVSKVSRTEIFNALFTLLRLATCRS